MVKKGKFNSARDATSEGEMFVTVDEGDKVSVEENVNNGEGDKSDNNVKDIHFGDSKEERFTSLDNGFEIPTQEY
ncbi:HNH endonuclease [Sesbania bispinosa]|nr:HNH endonuclease [Sesbania bispinosa]